MQYIALSSVLRSRRIILLLVLLLTTMASTPRGPSPQQRSPAIPDYEALAVELEEIRQILRIPGFSAAVVDHHQLVWAQGFGYADVERNIPATPDTPFHLASLTKPIAATLLTQLVAVKVLAMGAAIAAYAHYRPAGSAGAALAIPAMLLAGWLLLRLPLTAVSSYDIGWWLPARTLLPELGETVGALLGILPVMLFITERLLTGVGPDTPLFWAAALVAAPAGALPVYLYNLWLVRRGDAPWPGYRGAQPRESSYQMRFE